MSFQKHKQAPIYRHKENHEISVRVNRSIKANLKFIALPSQEITTYLDHSSTSYFWSFFHTCNSENSIANVFKNTFKLKIIMWCVFSIFSSGLKREHNLSAKAVWQTRRYQLYSTTEFSFFFLCRPSHGNKTPYRGMSTLRPVSSPTIFFWSMYVAENLNQRVCSFTKS